MSDLHIHMLQMMPVPSSIIAAYHQGVREDKFPGSTMAQEVLGGEAPPVNGVCRSPDGRVLVTCVTEMPDVTPAMIDWWFGWHITSSERYRLWHPKAHVSSSVAEDRSYLPNDKLRYLNNTSHVDEYIGNTLKKLSIEFVPPGIFGISDLDVSCATAICAYTTDRVIHGRGGCLIHYVGRTQTGAQMRSGFWLGEFSHNLKTVDRILHRILNTRFVRSKLISDRMALDLFVHCGEEMNHLARFLPKLYNDAHTIENE